ncbi:Crp/Fnr family transcriptional regulator [Thioclava nitratireducens]|uniref:Crp/Fnr family transcriptional regulator n=1 Tax=Thioclava nitratireducens TaxID=1915078 RepID=UPI0024807F13|nr:Crp/Fnr family transcriptional regulator [Thioclava nitratireducens]WGT49886.1 Crp/Fnr family transcriptional regulator [Thioclava nitratireducens]
MNEHSKSGKRIEIEGVVAQGKLQRLLDALPPELRTEMIPLWQSIRFAPGDVLIEDGEVADRIGFVADGFLAMSKTLQDRHRHIIGLITPSDMFGRAFNGPSGYRIEALSDGAVLTCDRQKFEAILARSHAAERLFLLSILDELDAAREWVMVLGSSKVVERLASLLIILSRHKYRTLESCARDNIRLGLHIHIKRVDIAHLLGTSPESLSRAFHELEREGAIRIVTPYDIEISNLGTLVDISGNSLEMRDA